MAKGRDIRGAFLCACGEPAEFATFFFNGDATEVSCTKCHVIAIMAMMAEANAEAQEEAERMAETPAR